jgi:hypothetical protein
VIEVRKERLDRDFRPLLRCHVGFGALVR